MYEATGKIKLISDTQTFPSGFTKREFVITTGNTQYPQDIKFELIKDKCNFLDNFQVGQDVTVHFDIRGNEYNGKYYVNLSCWKITAGQAGGAQPAPQQQQQPVAQQTPAPTTFPQAEPSPDELRSDDIPF